METAAYYHFCHRCGKETVAMTPVSRCSFCGEKGIEMIGNTKRLDIVEIGVRISRRIREWRPPQQGGLRRWGIVKHLFIRW